MAEFGSEVRSFIEQKRERNKRLQMENRQNIGQIAGQLAQREEEKLGYKNASEQINKLGRDTLGNEWTPVTWGQVANQGADIFLQDIDMRKRNAQAELMGIKTTTTGEGGTEQPKTSVQIGADIQALGETKRIELGLTKQFPNLSDNPIATEILGELKDVPLAELPDKEIEITKKIQSLNEFDSKQQEIRDNGLSIGVDFDVTPYNEMYRDDPLEATRQMENDSIVQFAPAKASALRAKGLIWGNKEIVKLTDDKDANLVMEGMSRDNRYRFMFDNGILKEEYATPEMILQIKDMTTDYKNGVSAINDSITLSDKRIATADKEITNVIERAKNDKDYAVLVGLSDGTYRVDRNGNVTDIATNNKIKVQNGDYVMGEYDKIIALRTQRDIIKNQKDKYEDDKTNILRNKIAGYAEVKSDLLSNYGISNTPKTAQDYNNISSGGMAKPTGVDTGTVVDINKISVGSDGVLTLEDRREELGSTAKERGQSLREARKDKITKLSEDVSAKKEAKSEKKKEQNKKVLSAKKERDFAVWYRGMAKKLGISQNPDDPEHFYDYRAFFDKYGRSMDKDVLQSKHFPSEFKLDGHPNRFIEIDGKMIDTKTNEEVK